MRVTTMILVALTALPVAAQDQADVDAYYVGFNFVLCLNPGPGALEVYRWGRQRTPEDDLRDMQQRLQRAESNEQRRSMVALAETANALMVRLAKSLCSGLSIDEINDRSRSESFALCIRQVDEDGRISVSLFPDGVEGECPSVSSP